VKFILVNPSNPAKTEKTHERTTTEEEINPVQPFQCNVHANSPLAGHDAQSNAGGGDVEVSN